MTSRVNETNFKHIVKEEFTFDVPPSGHQKKHIIVTARVHPGESNASYMMEGFMRFIMGSSKQA